MMKTAVSIFLSAMTALMLAGCGSTKQLEQSVADKQAAIDKLETEKKALESENSRLKGQVTTLEQGNRDAQQRAAQAEAEANRLRMELDKMQNPPKPSDSEGAYREGLEMFNSGRYADAAKRFEWLIQSGIGDPLEDNCHYWMGESYFGLGNYAEAIVKFQAVLAYEWSNKKDDAQLMIARSLARSGDLARAKEEYQRLIDVYPASPYIDKAREKVAAM